MKKENTPNETKKEVITLNKTKLNSFKVELTKVTKSMTKLSKLAFELSATPETKKLFISEVAKMGMSRTTAYALINAGKAINERPVLEDSEYSKTAEIGKLDEIEDNIEVFEGEIETPIEEYVSKKSQKEIRDDVKNFNTYGTINPLIEDSEETEEEQETTTPSNVERLAVAMNALKAVFGDCDNEDVINCITIAMSNIETATGILSEGVLTNE